MMLKADVLLSLFFSLVTSFFLLFRSEYIVVSFDLLFSETSPVLPTQHDTLAVNMTHWQST